jgi:hypothetical protein
VKCFTKRYGLWAWAWQARNRLFNDLINLFSRVAIVQNRSRVAQAPAPVILSPSPGGSQATTLGALRGVLRDHWSATSREADKTERRQSHDCRLPVLT